MLNRFIKEPEKKNLPAISEAPPSPADGDGADRSFEERGALNRELIEAKVRLHRKLIDDLNLASIERMPRDELRRSVGELVAEYVKTERILLNAKELESFSQEVYDELTGLGPLEPLLKDPSISDILINTHDKVYVERHGKLEAVAVQFKDEAHILRIVNKIVGAVGRRVDESQPMIDARLADGSRINVAIPPVAVDGPLVSIRKFLKETYDLKRLVDFGTLNEKMAEMLGICVQSKLSILISGGTGSGKTTLLNALSSHIPDSERLITIEDAAELRLMQPHVCRLETRPPNIEGRGEIRQRELVKNALRMRPDRIIVGEVRGEEAFDMLQAMNTGHEGSMATIHANNPRDALSRLAQMVGMAGMPMSEASIRGQIASAINLIVQLQRFSDGRRRIVSVSEITGMERDVILMQELFRFVRQGVSPDGKIRGAYTATGIRPSFIEDIRVKGFQLPQSFFDPASA
ncbi:MAG TPA: CpaF family protein [Hyphomicrobiales bacterium]|nr:CpaF family protein [Hyphomicrobiales bacterium]